MSNRLPVGRSITKINDRVDLVHARFEPDDGIPYSVSKQPERLPGFSIWIEAQK